MGVKGSSRSASRFVAQRFLGPRSSRKVVHAEAQRTARGVELGAQAHASSPTTPSRAWKFGGEICAPTSAFSASPRKLLLLLCTAISRGGAECAENCPRRRDPCATAKKRTLGLWMERCGAPTYGARPGRQFSAPPRPSAPPRGTPCATKREPRCATALELPCAKSVTALRASSRCAEPPRR